MTIEEATTLTEMERDNRKMKSNNGHKILQKLV